MGEGGGPPQQIEAIVYENVNRVSCGDAFTVATTAGQLVFRFE